MYCVLFVSLFAERAPSPGSVKLFGPNISFSKLQLDTPEDTMSKLKADHVLYDGYKTLAERIKDGTLSMNEADTKVASDLIVYDLKGTL